MGCTLSDIKNLIMLLKLKFYIIDTGINKYPHGKEQTN